MSDPSQQSSTALPGPPTGRKNVTVTPERASSAAPSAKEADHPMEITSALATVGEDSAEQLDRVGRRVVLG